jgi:hypothetical protein
MVHLLGCLKIAATLGEFLGEVNKFGRLRGSMASTERGMWSGNRGATLTAAGSEMLASLRSKGGLAGFIFHSYTFLRWWCTPTRVFLKKRLQAIENKGREGEKHDKEALS